jgi:hypothetical protein
MKKKKPKAKPKAMKSNRKAVFKAVNVPLPPVTPEKCTIDQTHLVQLKLTNTEYELLNRFAVKHGFASRSAYLRAGLGKMFDQHCITPEEDKQIEKERRKHEPRRFRMAR